MNQLTTEKRVQILGCLTEGMSLRGISRLTGVSINTTLKLIADVGTACQAYQDATLRNLPCKRIQADEIWSFVQCKARKAQGKPGCGDLWTWVGLCADTRLAVHWRVGDRHAGEAFMFIHELKSRLANRVQLTTDGHAAYLSAVETVFGAEVDYAQLVKLYGIPPEGNPERRYSPAQCIGARKVTISGSPDMANVSTSYVEAQNLTLRMNCRRFARLTNAHSKKRENHAHAVAINYCVHNFVKIHSSLRCTPAMAAGISKTVWELSDVIGLLDSKQASKAA
jgi:IS1 family transposase